MERILEDYTINAAADDSIDATIDGFVIDRPMSARSALSSLAQIFGVQAKEEMGVLQLSARPGEVALSLTDTDVVAESKQPLVSARRAQESELPIAVTLAFTDTDDDYQVATVTSRRMVGPDTAQPEPRQSRGGHALGDGGAGRYACCRISGPDARP